MDAFEIYREWFAHHYGHPFVCTREQWEEWCAQGRRTCLEAMALAKAEARQIDVILADQREIDRERTEGWAY